MRVFLMGKSKYASVMLSLDLEGNQTGLSVLQRIYKLFPSTASRKFGFKCFTTSPLLISSFVIF